MHKERSIRGNLRRAIFLAVLGIVVSLSGAFAQISARPSPLSPGRPARGEIRADGPLYGSRVVAPFTFQGRSGETIVLELRSSDFDAYLLLVTPSERILTDDDGAGGTDSRISLQLGETGEYRVFASSFSGSETGAFTLSLGEGAARSSAPAADAPREDLQPAERLFDEVPGVAANSGRGLLAENAVSIDLSTGSGIGSGEVSDGHAVFTLVVPGERRMDAEVVVTDVQQGLRYTDDDSMLFLFDSEGLLLEQDDDSGEGYASRIQTRLPARGTYFLVVTTYNNVPELNESGYLTGFPDDGGSSIRFDLVVQLR